MNTIIFTGNSYATGNIGLGFAIPINMVKKTTDMLKQDGKIDRNYWIGLRIQNIDNNIAQYYKLESTQGVIVVSVEKGSPADDAGIKSEDIIQEVNGEKVGGDYDFWGIITESKIGDKIRLGMLRGGDEIEKEFELRVK
jgi:S1-C subfamily serine protease